VGGGSCRRKSHQALFAFREGRVSKRFLAEHCCLPNFRIRSCMGQAQERWRLTECRDESPLYDATKHRPVSGRVSAIPSALRTQDSALRTQHSGLSTQDFQSPKIRLNLPMAPSTCWRCRSTSLAHLRNSSKVIAGGSSKCSLSKKTRRRMRPRMPTGQ